MGRRGANDLLLLATPYRGRAIPFQLVSYSSKTISGELASRNQEHWRAWAELCCWTESFAESDLVGVNARGAAKLQGGVVQRSG